MAKNLFITSINAESGKSAIALGVMELLLRDIRKVGFFRPIINPSGPGERDHDIDLILSHFYLGLQYNETYAVTLDQAKHYINSGRQNDLMENILIKYQLLADKCDFVLCEGTDFKAGHEAFNIDIDAAIAANFGSPAIIVSSADDSTVDEVVSLCQLAMDSLKEKSVDTMGVIVNKAKIHDKEAILSALKKNISIPDSLFYVLPEEPTLANPTMNDVKKWLKAEVLYGSKELGKRINGYVIAAMRIENFLNYLKDDNLVVTASDRSDIILGSLASRLSSAYPNISGILLTGGQTPPPSIKRLVEGWAGLPVPILLVQDSTFPTVSALNELKGTIDPDNPQKIATALGLFEANVKTSELKEKLISRKSSRVTPQMFEYKLIREAKRNKMHIVLPEGTSERILKAADILLRRDVCNLTLLGKEEEIGNKISKLGLELDGINIVNPERSPHFEEYVLDFFEMRKEKGVTMDMAVDFMADETYWGTMMIQKGAADGMVSGSVNTTAHTIRPAFQIIKTVPGTTIVSSVFLMCLKDRVLVFGDCAIIPNPTAEQLAEIAVVSADTAKLFGIDPRVAMLSYSTGDSGKGAEVEKVIKATKIAQKMRPDLLLEGPIQYDAAIDPEVAETKLPDSKVAGKATVFIFPDLNTGNNTYKAVQRATPDSLAIGPVLQGLKKPVNDLSRGCTVHDIVNTVAITAIQGYASTSKEKNSLQAQDPGIAEKGKTI
ncbi:phosphate acetyltransferase [Desulfopila inferna]|uniref:phosphate acetyltransferase n=1 Tax=Desulfopila inferna TaxID=468528 RepID=UPI001963424C|nr:phosphate acetyltransferase [Desulfopila inferna]MBM9603308.1 phosphate acetyltransferase [Desulfopila inferna]